MPFLARLTSLEPYETWPGMEQAAEARFWDGFTLAAGDSDNQTGSIYLLGYVVEMLLKTAYFRVTHVGMGENIAPHLQGARTHALWQRGNLHNLRSWIALLNDIRFAQGMAWDVVTATIIESHVLTVAAHWSESLRYTSVSATRTELDEVFASAEWLLTNRELLWR